MVCACLFMLGIHHNPVFLLIGVSVSDTSGENRKLSLFMVAMCIFCQSIFTRMMYSLMGHSYSMYREVVKPETMEMEMEMEMQTHSQCRSCLQY